MPLLTLRNLRLSHSYQPLLVEANLSIEKGEKVCIIGRNGAGKSSLLRCILGENEPDSGIIEHEPGLTMAMLQQTIPNDIDHTVRELIISKVHKDTPLYLIEKTLSQLDLDGNQLFNRLSGGLKRRALLACALTSDPDILLLDEPTNHLDIESIQWLENFLKRYSKTVVFITHDRLLMEHVATHIVEIDHSKLISWRGHYQKYWVFKEDYLRSEEKAQALFDKKLAQEEVWIRQGIKARRTRNEGRVCALEKMREQRARRISRQGNVKLANHDIAQAGKVVLEVEHLDFRYDDQILIRDFSTIIQRGDKIGIIGANGSGKSTLINCLLGKITPSSGKITSGTNLEIAYFDQTQSELNDSLSVQDNIGEGSSSVTIAGKQKHIMSYLQDFLFTPEQARKPLRNLSGGERNRVMLAKLLLKPCNLLVLDEPTNDLDVETLELLETALVEFTGTILLVSHDREFLNNVVTSTLVMEGDGVIGEYIGGYDDWLRQKPTRAKRDNSAEVKLAPEEKSQTTRKKLSFNEQRELDQLPGKIEKLERRQQELQTLVADPNIYKQSPEKAPLYQQELQSIDAELESAYLRWQQLET